MLYTIRYKKNISRLIVEESEIIKETDKTIKTKNRTIRKSYMDEITDHQTVMKREAIIITKDKSKVNGYLKELYEYYLDLNKKDFNRAEEEKNRLLKAREEFR